MHNFHKTLIRDIILAAGIISMLGLISIAKLQNNPSNSCSTTVNIESGNIPSTPLTPIPCYIFFDIYKHGICVDIPDYYYFNNPVCYDKTKIYFNLRPGINYTKAGICRIDDILLTINKMDYNIISMFWLVV